MITDKFGKKVLVILHVQQDSIIMINALIEQEPRRFIYVKRATIMDPIFGVVYPPHHKKVLLPGLGCGFVPEITKLVTPLPKIYFLSISA